MAACLWSGIQGDPGSLVAPDCDDEDDNTLSIWNLLEWSCSLVCSLSFMYQTQHRSCTHRKKLPPRRDLTAKKIEHTQKM